MILEVCNTVTVLSVMKILLTIFNILKVLIPIILILSAIISFKDALIYHRVLKDVSKEVITKFIIAVMIMFVPTIVFSIAKYATGDENSYLDCITNANDDAIDKILVNEVNDGLTSLKSDLNTYKYYKINSKISTINDESTEEKYANKLKEYKTYVDMNTEITKLTDNCKTSDYKDYNEQIEKIPDNTIKETLSTALEKACAKKALSETGTITGSNELTYHVFIPENATTNMPLVLYLHGDGSTSQALSNKFWANAKAIYGDDVPFIVVAPEGGMWAETDGRLENLKNIIEEVCTKYECDTERIIATGHSRGSIGTWVLANQYPSMFYAIVPVSCGTSRFKATNFKNIKVWAFGGNQGEAEQGYTSRMKSMVDSINYNGGNAKFTLLNTGHGGTPSLAYTKELYEWLLQ